MARPVLAPVVLPRACAQRVTLCPPLAALLATGRHATGANSDGRNHQLITNRPPAIATLARAIA